MFYQLVVYWLDLVAQLVEHWTGKPKVAGSIPTAVKQNFQFVRCGHTQRNITNLYPSPECATAESIPLCCFKENKEEDEIIYPYIFNCTSQHENYFLITTLGCKGLLLVFGIFLAWETRNIEIKALNDSKYIGISVYNVVILSVVGVILATLMSGSEYYNVYLALMSLVVILCTAATLGIVFVPKVSRKCFLYFELSWSICLLIYKIDLLNRLVVWFNCILSDWLTDRLSDWLIMSLIDYLIDWLSDQLIDYLTDWLSYWSYIWLIDLTNWLTDWSIIWLIDNLIILLIIYLIDYLTD